jgi:diaminopimelate epimerase
MEQVIPFTKMHGAGNDYIYVNTMEHPLENPESLSIAWSNRHTGIGADGLVLIGSSANADFSMRIFNADGSEALMCGNATRCIAKYVYEKGLSDKKTITLETLSGIKELRLDTEGGLVKEVTVDMGIPSVSGQPLSLEAGGKTYTGTAVSTGNPHFVIFVDDIRAVDLPVVGPLLETHPAFLPGRTNVEFVEVRNAGEVRMRVWERGSGITMACGTGACATIAASVATARTNRTAKVEMDGGTVTIHWDETSGRIFKTGPATIVFEGTIIINQ